MEYHAYWLLKRYCFELSRDRKYGLFLSQKVDKKIIFNDYWKVLVWNFSEMGNTVFFEPKNWWKDNVYWLLKRSCFELFGDGKYGIFFIKKFDRKMIFPWSFWGFYDIPGFKQYGFSCSAPIPLKVPAYISKHHSNHVMN